jgi:alpha-mannosidase
MTIRQGYELNYKLISLPVENHEGDLPAEHSFLQVPSENVIVSAVKKAEDDNSLVVRFYEWAGKQGDVTLQLPPGAKSATETDLMEKGSGSVPVNDGAVKVSTKPYEIKTVKVQFSGAPQTGLNKP